jgi:hypothetical protein
VCTSSRAFQAGGGYLQSSPHEGLFPLRRGSSLCQQLVQFGGLEIDTPGDGVSAAHYARLSVPQLLKVIARPLHTLLEIEACCAALGRNLDLLLQLSIQTQRARSLQCLAG